MNPGTLDKLITLQSPATASDGQGGKKRTGDGWTDVVQVYALFKEPRQGLDTSHGGIASVTTQQMIIRERSDVRGGWRVKYGDRYYAVDSVYIWRHMTVMTVKEVRYRGD